MNMADRIRRMREKRGMSQAALAKASGVPLSTLSVIDHGKRQGEKLTVATASKIAAALGVSLDYLAGMAEVYEEPTPSPPRPEVAHA
jgi:transcriptional regulator with XRE-family HTH domain